MNKYKVVIGIEMHCGIKSNTKVFTKGKNEYEKVANINVSHGDFAFPGILPIVNKECVRKAILMALILKCKVPEYLYFDRKNYYYPDLPKSYQITQVHNPIGVNGKITIDCDDYTKDILIHDIHLEEDTSSLDHYSDATLIDYNRAGVPLLELVTEPCINSADEALAFLEEMRRVYKFADVSDADIAKGQIRCDVNISIMNKDDKELGTRVEIKEINSFAGIYEAINYEVERQSKLKDEGRYDEVVAETRRYDEETGTTIRMRSKDDKVDYKIFIDPNIPKFKISNTWLEEIKKSIPVLPRDRKINYINNLGISSKNANIIIKEKDYSDYLEECLKLNMDAKIVSNWLTGDILAYLNKYDISLNEFYLKPVLLKQIIDALMSKKISSKQAKDIFNKCLEEKKDPINYLEKDNMQKNDSMELENIIKNIISNSKSQVDDYKNGHTNLFNYFVGQVMKETKGKANPIVTKQLLKKYLD